MAAGYDGTTLRILLLGKTGSGKSTVGNALLGGGKRFHVGRGIRSRTERTAWDKAVRKGIMFEVTDTPGLCDAGMDKSLVYKELAKSVAVAKPGPNIILFVLRADRRFAEEDRQAYETIKKLFSNEISKYLILVFNAIDVFGLELPIADQREALNTDIAELMRRDSEEGRAMDRMLADADERYIALNNRTSADVQQTQIQELVHMMLDLVKRNGDAVYSTEMTEEIYRRVDKMIEPQPGRDTPRRIIEEDVLEGFFEKIGDDLRRGLKKNPDRGASVCSVM